MELGNHAAGALGGGADTGQVHDAIINFGDLVQQNRIGILVGIGGIQTVDVRQQNQQVGLYGLGHLGGQGVVVTDDDFLGGYGVVFVDDGQSTQLQQTVQGVGKILMTGLVDHVVVGNQQLCHGMVILAEELVIDIHQFTLTHGSGCLLGGDILGTLPQTQLAHTHADGAGGYQNHFVTCILDIAHNLAEQFHPADIQMAGGMGQGRGTDFDDDSHKCMPSFVNKEFAPLYHFSEIR